jgi:hypothetical protein
MSLTLIEIKSRYDASVLFRLECASVKLCVEAAVKARATLRGADLWGADLLGADLWGATLRGAIRVKALLQIGPLDGWPVLLWSTGKGVRVQVGCHFFTLDEAEAHWRGKPDRTHLYDLVTEGWKTLVRLAGWEL